MVSLRRTQCPCIDALHSPGVGLADATYSQLPRRSRVYSNEVGSLISKIIKLRSVGLTIEEIANELNLSVEKLNID